MVFAMENGGFTGYWFTVLVLLVENRSFTSMLHSFTEFTGFNFPLIHSNDFETKWEPHEMIHGCCGLPSVPSVPTSSLDCICARMRSLSWSSRSVWALRLPIGTNGILHRAHLGATSPCDALIRCRTWVDGGWDCSEISEEFHHLQTIKNLKIT